METARLARPVRGNLARHERLFIFGLVVILTLGLASPAQAGLGDLLDDEAEELPVVGEIVDPVVEVVDPVVEEVVDPVVEVVDPVVEEVVDPVVEVVDPVVEVVDPVVEVVDPVVEVVDPVVEDVSPVVEDLVAPVADEDVSPIVEEGGLPTFESVAASAPSLAGYANQILTHGDDHGSLVLARSLQTALVGIAGTSPTIAGTLIDTSGAGWLMGLTDWLRSTTNSLLDLLSMPLRLLEILVRALLTAGSGLVAPASLALAFTIYAVRDRRWEGLRKTALI